MTTVTDCNGNEVDFGAAAPYMDAEIREELHGEGIDDAQEFFERYAQMHAERFGEGFAPYEGGAW